MKKMSRKYFSKLTKLQEIATESPNASIIEIEGIEILKDELKYPKMIYNGDVLKLQLSGSNVLKESKNKVFFNEKPVDFVTIIEEVSVC